MSLSSRFVENEKTTGGLEFAVGIEDALSAREWSPSHAVGSSLSTAGSPLQNRFKKPARTASWAGMKPEGTVKLIRRNGSSP